MKRNPMPSLAAAVLVATLASGQQSWLPRSTTITAIGSATTQKLELNAGKKWKTDAALRQSMDDINQAMARALPLIHKKRCSDSDYVTLASKINQKVGYYVEHCKLEAKADAMLHIVIGELMAGAEITEGKTAATPRWCRTCEARAGVLREILPAS